MEAVEQSPVHKTSDLVDRKNTDTLPFGKELADLAPGDQTQAQSHPVSQDNEKEDQLCADLPNPNVTSLADDMLQVDPNDLVLLSRLESALPETDSLKSVFAEINTLKESNSELRQTIATLFTRCSALEKVSEDLQCQNRTLERQLTMIQSESDRSKRRSLQVTAEVASTAATVGTGKPPNAETKSADEVSANSVTQILRADFDMTKKEVLKIGNDLTGVTSLVNDISGKVTWLESEFQRFMRRHSLIVENLCPKEDKSASEMFLVFVNSVLCVKLEDGEIESLHVIGQLQSNSASPEKRIPRPILVTFACYGTRSKIYKSWLSFRSSKMQGAGTLSGERGQGICIREYLTESQESFYHEAVMIRDKQLIADCWTFKGKTYVRTVEGDIKEFLNKDQWTIKQESSCNVM